MNLSYSLSKAKNEAYKVLADKFESPKIVIKEDLFLKQGTAESERTYFDEDNLLSTDRVQTVSAKKILVKSFRVEHFGWRNKINF